MTGGKSNGSGYDPSRHGPRRVVSEGFHEKVWDVVCSVPSGSVTTFGDIAAALGLRSVARQVGWALAALPPGTEDVPWHRVVNAQGQLSRRADGQPSQEQAQRLAREGLKVSEQGRVLNFAKHRQPLDDLGQSGDMGQPMQRG